MNVLCAKLLLRSGLRMTIVVSLTSAVLPAAEPPPRKPSLPAIYSYRAADIDTLRGGFCNPPREAGPWVYWMFFENVMAKEEITRELAEMAAAGIAGAEMRFLSLRGFPTRPGPWFDPAGWSRLGQQRLEFLSPEFVEMLQHACAEGRYWSPELFSFTFLSGQGRNLQWDGQQRLHKGPLADPQRQWETNLALLRWHAAAHFARGVNRIQMHSFSYSPLGVPPPGWRIYAEVHLNRQVPWWPYMKSLTPFWRTTSAFGS